MFASSCAEVVAEFQVSPHDDYEEIEGVWEPLPSSQPMIIQSADAEEGVFNDVPVQCSHLWPPAPLRTSLDDVPHPSRIVPADEGAADKLRLYTLLCWPREQRGERFRALFLPLRREFVAQASAEPAIFVAHNFHSEVKAAPNGCGGCSRCRPFMICHFITDDESEYELMLEGLSPEDQPCT